ncbi:hypothetical protein O1611_g240 [Lasiodiplodia mahajangana]|uniref:Uncharacterized protein n=1 Tax=Lasiodiplodia mahajangana TaxID=1108764 RepID=A0ACC2K1H9_9PEZI|nr:hypothetical protein O1611_g240 [Lasiodiplodia mahajangana]
MPFRAPSTFDKPDRVNTYGSVESFPDIEGKSFSQVAIEYRAKFSQDDLDEILKVEDPQMVLARLKDEDEHSNVENSRISRVIGGIDRYRIFLSVVGGASPEKSEFGTEIRDTMRAMIYDLCDLAPRVRMWESLFDDMESPEALKGAFLYFYRAVLDFFYEANQWIKSCPTGILRHTPKPPPIRVRSCLENIRKANKIIEDRIPAATLDLQKSWHQKLVEMLGRGDPRLQAALPCRSIPYPDNPLFTGRAEVLNQMREAFLTACEGQLSFALYGMGGVGKSQIALKYLYDHLDKYPAVFWITADSREKLTQAYVEAAKQLKLEPQESQRDPEAVIQLFKTWLSDTDANWILVFDNADDLSVLKPLWPPTKRGTIIVTSRDPSSALMTKWKVQVKSMTDGEGSSLFRSILRTADGDLNEDVEPRQIQQVIELLGHLPLAISQAASFMVERSCTVEDFLEIYVESIKSEHTFEGLNTESPNLFYEHSLATVWRISIGRLTPESTALLSILSCLDPDGVPEAMIRDGTKGSQSLRFLSNASSYTKVTKELLRNGLIWMRKDQSVVQTHSINPKPIRNVSLHRLIQETVFHQQSLSERNETFSRAVEICLNAFPHPTRTNFRLMHRWPECALYLPHLLALQSRYSHSTDITADVRLAELFLYAGWYLYERRAPEVAIPLLNTARNICTQEENHADWFLQSRILSAFGCVLFECSRFEESESFFRQALEIRLRNVSGDDILLAHGYQDTALPVSGQGRFEEALELQRRALDIIEKNNDQFTRRDMTFHVHHNMARTLEASGDFNQALRLHFHQGDEFGNGLRIEASESGAVNLYAIGNCYLALGDHAKGSQYHSRALDIRRRLVGEHGFYYGISLHKIGHILHNVGDHSAAIDAFQAAVEIFKGALDAQRELCRTLYHLSVAERHLDRIEQGEAHLQAAWKLRSEITGEPYSPPDPQMTADSIAIGFDKLVIYIHA